MTHGKVKPPKAPKCGALEALQDPSMMNNFEKKTDYSNELYKVEKTNRFNKENFQMNSQGRIMGLENNPDDNLKMGKRTFDVQGKTQEDNFGGRYGEAEVPRHL